MKDISVRNTNNVMKKYTTDKPLEKPLVPIGTQMLEVLADENATKEERDMALATILEIVSVPIRGC